MHKFGVLWRKRREDGEVSLAEERGCRTYDVMDPVFEIMSDLNITEGCFIKLTFSEENHKVIDIQPVKCTGRVQLWTKRYAFVETDRAPLVKVTRNKRVQEFKINTNKQNVYFSPSSLEFKVNTDDIVNFDIYVGLTQTRKNKNAPYLDLIAKNICSGTPVNYSEEMEQPVLKVPKKKLTSWFDRRMSGSSTPSSSSTTTVASPAEVLRMSNASTESSSSSSTLMSATTTPTTEHTPRPRKRSGSGRFSRPSENERNFTRRKSSESSNRFSRDNQTPCKKTTEKRSSNKARTFGSSCDVNVKPATTSKSTSTSHNNDSSFTDKGPSLDRSLDMSDSFETDGQTLEKELRDKSAENKKLKEQIQNLCSKLNHLNVDLTEEEKAKFDFEQPETQSKEKPKLTITLPSASEDPAKTSAKGFEFDERYIGRPTSTRSEMLGFRYSPHVPFRQSPRLSDSGYNYTYYNQSPRLTDPFLHRMRSDQTQPPAHVPRDYYYYNNGHPRMFLQQ